MCTDSVIISRIEILNKRKHTYGLYCDDVFLAEISEDTLVHFTISRGSEYSPKKFNEIIEYNNLVNCLNQSYEFLKRRPHLKTELYRKLKNKKFNPVIIKRVIEELQKKQYLDDREFITLYIRDQIRQRKSGPLLIKKKLLEKGALKYDVDVLLDTLFTEEEQLAIAKHLLDKKLTIIREQDKLKRKQKLYQYIQGRGFSWPVIEQAFTQIDFNDDS